MTVLLIGAAFVLLIASFVAFPAASVIAILIIVVSLALTCLAVAAVVWLPLSSALSRYAAESKRFPAIAYMLISVGLAFWGGHYVGTNPDESRQLMYNAVDFTLQVNDSIEQMIFDSFYEGDALQESYPQFEEAEPPAPIQN